ncbi:MAG: hypothetical protein H0W72_14615 [Planctomycetes bacterium]|nr:hypothetical protein [Planctomycetota bacterium]
MLIKPITVRLIAYGPQANLDALRGRAEDVLKDEHGKVDAACFVIIPAREVHAEIIAKRLDVEVPLKAPTASRPGIAITLPEVNERLTTEWLFEMPVAKTCVVFATWFSPREAVAWQLLIAQGNRWSENRPHTALSDQTDQAGH